ncbi:MAG TPA: hypothetical protein VFU69_03230 [Ktedonobacterales bacterium]|nr:hypothetical protein [Ktedonobacterales bacterium]
MPGSPKSPAFPSGRYNYTNPLRREAGLRLLTESLPEPLRWAIIRAWRWHSRAAHPQRAPEAPSAHRQRPSEASLPAKSPYTISLISLVELEMAWRIVEAPQTSLKPVERNAMLSAQGAYLRCLYAALAWQIGEAAALAEFQRLLLRVE